MEKDDLHTLTVMVALTAGMTSVVMIAVFMLIIMKLKKRNRIKKKILPSSVFTVEKEKVDIDVSQRSLKEGDNSKLPGQTMVPLKTGTSMSTMITQLSQDSSILQNQSINNSEYTLINKWFSNVFFNRSKKKFRWLQQATPAIRRLHT